MQPSKTQSLNEMEVNDLKTDIRQIYELLRAVADKISVNNTEVAVHRVQISHLNDLVATNNMRMDDVDLRLKSVEDMRVMARGFVSGLKIGPALLLTAGGGTVGAVISWLISFVNGGGNHNVGG